MREEIIAQSPLVLDHSFVFHLLCLLSARFYGRPLDFQCDLFPLYHKLSAAILCKLFPSSFKRHNTYICFSDSF